MGYLTPILHIPKDARLSGFIGHILYLDVRG